MLTLFSIPKAFEGHIGIIQRNAIIRQLAEQGHGHRYSLTAFEDTKLESLATQGFVLSCGKEDAVAATKSVIEQALFYDALLQHIAGEIFFNLDLESLEKCTKVNESWKMNIFSFFN